MESTKMKPSFSSKWLSDAVIDITPLKMGIFHFLSGLKKTFYNILNFCSFAWITSTLTFGPKSSIEEIKHLRPVKLDKLHSGDEELEDELRSIQDINTSSNNRLRRFEEKVENLEIEFFGEKDLWRTKFQELFQDQQTLKKQQQEYVHHECTSSENLMAQYTDAAYGLDESNVDVRDGLHSRLGDQVKYSRNPTYTPSGNGLEGPSSLKYASLPVACSSVPCFDCTNAQKASKCFRVFVPRSPLDLNIGSRVKVILPSGKVGTGVVYKVDFLSGKDELQVGVDMESQQHWQHLNKCKVQYKFHSDPPSGVLVSFSKVLMVWE